MSHADAATNFRLREIGATAHRMAPPGVDIGREQLRHGVNVMSSDLTEDEMRQALGLGGTPASPADPSAIKTARCTAAKVVPGRRAGTSKLKSRSPKLRVTLLVSKEFEGESVVFVHDADTLSRFDAEQEAKTLAKKDKYRFFEVVSIKPIG